MVLDDQVHRRALVTGSTRGVGRGIAEHLSAVGYRVAVNGRSTSRVAEVVAEIDGAVPAPGDVSTPIGAEEAVSGAGGLLGGLDLVVCNVGGGRSVPPGEETYEEWQRVFALNLWSATNVVASARATLARTTGSIVCISSVCGSAVVQGAPVTYSAAKSALHAYVRGVAGPLGRDGIRINAIPLGNMLFEGSVWSTRLAEDAEGVRSMLSTEVPLGRLGTPEEVSALVEFLGSERASFATGSVWTLDGGQVRS